MGHKPWQGLFGRILDNKSQLCYNYIINWDF